MPYTFTIVQYDLKSETSTNTHNMKYTAGSVNNLITTHDELKYYYNLSEKIPFSSTCIKSENISILAAQPYFRKWID